MVLILFADQTPIRPPPVTSVFTRTGAVIAQAGDYTANLVTNVPTGAVSANTVQGAITELDAEKLALVGGDMTGTIKSTAQNALQVGPYGAAAGNTGEVHYLELAGNGIQYVGFKAPDSVNTNVIWTLPAAAGASGTVLTSNTGDILSWSSPSALGIGDVVGPASSSDNAIARFNSTTGKIIKNSTVVLDDSGNLTGVTSINGNTSTNFVTLIATPTGANFVYLSNGADKIAKTTDYTLPPTKCASGEILKADASGNLICTPDASGVISFNGRSGVVVPVANDYTAVMVTNTPAGAIAATSTQGALNELDTEKLALAGGTMTGTLKTTIQDAIEIGAPGANTGEIRFFEASAGPNYAGFKSPAVLGLNYILTLPIDGGVAGQILSTTGAGVLAWTTPGGGGAGGVGDVVGPAASVSTNLASFNGVTGKLIQDSGISSNNVMTMTGPALAAGNILVSQGVNKVAIDSTINVGPGNSLTGLGTLNGRTIANWVDGPAGAISTNLAAFNGATGKLIQDSGLLTANIPTMALNATAANQMILSGGVSKQFVAASYTVPAGSGATGQVLTVTAPNVATWANPVGVGDVVGPSTSTNNALVRFDSTTGKLIQNSVAILDDLGALTGITSINGKIAGDFVTMATGATVVGQVMLSSGAGKAAVVAPYTFPVTTGTPGQILQLGVTGLDATWQTIAGGDVTGPNGGTLVNELAVFSDTTGKAIKNVTLTYLNIVTTPANFTAPNRVALTGGAASKALAESSYTVPPGACPVNQILKSDGTNYNCAPAGTGDVVGPGAASDNAIARYDNVTGKLIQNSTVILDDAGSLAGVLNINTIPVTNFVTMTANAGSADRLYLSFGADKIAKTTTYTFPTANGTAGQVLTSNGAGAVNWGTPPPGDVVGPSSSTINNLSSFSDTTGKVLKDSGINSANLSTMALDATAPNQMILSGGVSKQLVATPYTVPGVNGTPGQVLTVTGANTTAWQNAVGTGDVIGPASATGNALVRFNSTTGKLIQDSVAILDNAGALSGITSINGKTAVDFVTMPTAASTTGQVFLSAGAGKSAVAAAYTFPTSAGTVGQILKLGASGDATWQTVAGGDVSGPANSIVDQLAVFADGTGKLIKNVTLTYLNVVRNPNPVVGGNLASFNGSQTPGVIIQDSGVVAADVISKTSPFTAANKIAISNGNDRLLLETPYGVPPLVGADGQILKLSAGNLVWSADLGDVTGPISSTDGNLAAFNGATGKIIKDTPIKSAEVMTMVGVAPLIGNVLTSAGLDRTAQVSPVPLANIPLMANPAVSSNTIVISSGADKNLKTTDYTLPATKCPVGSILKTDAAQNFTCVADTSGVTSFNARTGVVVPLAGDYTGAMVSNTGTGAISSTNTQGAINELEAEKLALTGGTMTGDLITTSLITNTQNGVQLGPSGGNTGEVRFLESVAGGDYVGFKAPNSLAGNVIWTLPAAAGASGTVLTTNNSNVLTWSSPSAIGVGDVTGPASSVDNAIARFDLTTGKLIQNSVVTIDDSGNISGAGTISSSGDLTVTGNLNVTGTGSFNGALSAQSYTNTSDKILKKDIEPFTGASSLIDKLMPVTFRWKSGDEKKVIGLIAQDIEKVIPEVVSTSKQKNKVIKSYDLGQVLILTLEALKETREELKQTKTELKVMREKVQDLEKRIP